MSRVIKFRAFSTKSGMWNWERLSERHPLSCLYSHDGWQVMQFTGLLDKNGKEIYEGDLIDVARTFDASPLPVEFNKLGHICVVDERGQHSLLISEVEKCEVVGNIYENPELLEAQL